MNYFKRIQLISILLLILTMGLTIYTQPLLAAPLRNIPQTLTQPDGSIIHCFASGDEFHNWLHDSAGYTIIQDPETGFYTYAVKKGAQIISSRHIVGQVNPQRLGLEKNVNLTPDAVEKKRTRFYKHPRSLSKGANSISLLNGVSTNNQGTINTIVIFIRFSDEAEFNANINTYETMFNSTDEGVISVHNYYQSASYNQITINSSFYPEPVNNMVVSYQDLHPRSYYKAYNQTTNPDGYDPDIPYSEHQNEQGRIFREHSLLKNAIESVSDQIPTGLNIDSDNDDFVDNVCFIISGSPEGWNELLWPHQFNLWSQEAYINEKKVNLYSFQIGSETNVPVISHETFHVLGAPDLYHYSQDNLMPVGPWDIMATTGDTPQHMGAYMKYRYGGWINDIPEIRTSGNYTLNPLSTNSNNCYKIQSPNSIAEFFVLEYRNNNSIFENSIPGNGLLVYRINMEESGYGNREGPPDEIYIYRPAGTLESAGEILQAHYSQENGKIAISDQTSPNCFLSDGSPGGLNISNIGSAEESISFTVDIDFKPREYFSYDDVNFDGIGTNSAANLIAAARFTSQELGEFYGKTLTHIMFYIKEGGGNDVTIKVWEGGSNNGPGNIKYERNIADEVVLNGWTVHKLTNPIVLQEGQEYWLGYQINATGGFPIGVDAGPIVADKGAWLYLNDQWNTLEAFGQSKNLNVRGCIDETGSGVALASIISSQLEIRSKPGQSGQTAFLLKNSGNASLHYNITTSSKENNGNNNIRINAPERGKLKINQSPLTNHQPKAQSQEVSHLAKGGANQTSNLLRLQGDEVLILDDGDGTPDDFMGYGDNYYNFAWANKFTAPDPGFRLESVQFYMQTENATTNDVYITILNEDLDTLATTYKWMLPLAANGTWYTMNLSEPLEFKSGESFYALIEPLGIGYLFYPAGFDTVAQVTGHSYYVDRTTNTLTNINGYAGWENAAFLIRAEGTLLGTENQAPVAVGQISTDKAAVGETITFDASKSYDNDGQITSYLWDFGDGNNSTQQTTTHSYNSADTYTIQLSVTDDEGATDQVSGYIEITAEAERLSCTPQAGTINAGDSTSISVIFNAGDLDECNFSGQVYVKSNGGDFTIPVNIIISNTLDIATDISSQLDEYYLYPNYPNPFNPQTTIKYKIPADSDILLCVYDITGRQIKTLDQGMKSAGFHTVQWDGMDEKGKTVANGIYIYQLQFQDRNREIKNTLTRKMVMIK